MLMNPDKMKQVFDQALNYQAYVETGTNDQKQRWRQVYDAVRLYPRQKDLLAGFVREMPVLVLSGIWCGDCVEQGPLLARIAEQCERIHLRFIDRDAIAELRDQLKINAGTRVPVVMFMAEDYALCNWYGDRSLNRYRRLAQKQLGPACSTGLFIPDSQELQLTLQDWLDEFERIQLMLRLSTRLREKHGD